MHCYILFDMLSFGGTYGSKLVFQINIGRSQEGRHEEQKDLPQVQQHRHY